MRISVRRRIAMCLSVFGILLWAMLPAFSMTAFAAEDDGILKMYCETEDGVVFEGMHWDIFLVGGRDDEGNFELQGDFAEYPVSLADTTTSAMTAAAETLENYATIDGIAPLASADANENGFLQFSMLEPGLYLLAGDYVVIDDVYYFPSAFLMEVPEDGETVFNMNAYPKYISMNAGEGGLDYTVKKVWENDETEPENRSVFITAAIYRDGVLHETVRLDESNDWTYAWTADKFYEWRVIELEVPDGYDVVYRSNETQYVIVNTFTKSSSVTETVPETDDIYTETLPETDDITTETGDQPETGIQTDVTEQTGSDGSAAQTSNPSPTTTTTTTTTTTDDTENLPQTGQLWWPVPVLGVAGLLSVAIGLRLVTKE